MVRKTSKRSKSRSRSRSASPMRRRRVYRKRSSKGSRKGSRRGSRRNSRRTSKRRSSRRGSRKGSRRGSRRSSRHRVSKRCSQKVTAHNCTKTEIQALLRRKGLLANPAYNKDQLLGHLRRPEATDYKCHGLRSLHRECDKEKLVNIFNTAKAAGLPLPAVNPNSLTHAELYHVLQKERVRQDRFKNYGPCETDNLVACTKHELLDYVRDNVRDGGLDRKKAERATRTELINLIKYYKKNGQVKKSFKLSGKRGSGGGKRGSGGGKRGGGKRGGGKRDEDEVLYGSDFDLFSEDESGYKHVGPRARGSDQNLALVPYNRPASVRAPASARRQLQAGYPEGERIVAEREIYRSPRGNVIHEIGADEEILPYRSPREEEDIFVEAPEEGEGINVWDYMGF